MIMKMFPVEKKKVFFDLSGFRPGDSTINQPIFLVHKIYEA